MICRPSKHRSSDHHLAILRLFGNAPDQETLEAFLHDHLWIIEEELRMCIGLPPWFDSALCFVVAEISRAFANCRPRNASTPQWIREKAKQVGKKLERTLPRRHARNGLVTFEGDATLVSLLGLLLQRPRSLYWEELRGLKSPSPRCRTLGDGI